MFQVNEDCSIYATRGDIVFFSVSIDDNGVARNFLPGDVVHLKVYGKKDTENVVLNKRFPVARETDSVQIYLERNDTKIGEVISKPKDYWYSVTLNDDTVPQTIIGYDEEGPKVFRLFPEGADIPPFVPSPEDIKVMDTELDMTSDRPVQNQAIARAIVALQADYEKTKDIVVTKSNETAEGLAIERNRIDNIVSHNAESVSKSLEYLGDSASAKVDATITSDGVHAVVRVNFREANLMIGNSKWDAFIVPDECRPIGVGHAHTEYGVAFDIRYDTENKRYVLAMGAADADVYAPTEAIIVTFTYALADFEVKDIRVGAGGKVYDTAGNAVRAQFDGIKAHIKEFEPHIWYQSKNRFNADEQAEDTVVPYYHGVDGKPTANDGYHFTAPIPLKPNTKYTIGYVPSVNIGNDEVTVPWHNASVGCFLYDKNGNVLGRTQDATFTTTPDTAYIRFNFLRSNYYNLNLQRVKEICMIIEGDNLPDTFSPYYNYFIDDVVDNMKERMESIANTRKLHYDIQGDVLTVVSKYTADKDFVTILQKKGGNNIFDFYRFGTIDNNTDIPSSDVSGMTQFLGISTDCHAPFNVTALNNADGDALASSVYTGGNHAYNGVTTGRTSSIRFFVDGHEKTEGAGYADAIKVVWENLVQAWNTVKANGTGREVIKERHTIVFDGEEWKETIELYPLEDIKMSVWYGLQMYGLTTVYKHIRYVGGINRGINDASVDSNCGDNVASKVIGYGDEHKFEMEIDPAFDLGKRTMYSGTTGIFTSNAKCYFYIVRNQEMKGDTLYSLKGVYRFLPI